MNRLSNSDADKKVDYGAGHSGEVQPELTCQALAEEMASLFCFGVFCQRQKSDLTTAKI